MKEQGGLLRVDMPRFKINCPMCNSFVKEFFTHSISLTVRDLVIAHLLQCKECENNYALYALNIGLDKWDIKKEAKKLIMSCGEHPEKCTHTREAYELLENIKVSELQRGRYTRAVTNWNVSVLKDLQSFDDVLTAVTKTASETPMDDNHVAFMKYEILKIAKRIDHLEECLAKSKEQANEK